MIHVNYSELKYLKEENIFNFSSNKEGLNVAILAGVHGDEKSGIIAIKEVVKNFEVNSGNVIFIICNQKAINENKRYIDENLNRCFLKSKIKTNNYEENIANELKVILNQCDICLDLHNSTSIKSEPFIICERNATKYLDSINCKKVCYGFDTNEPGGTDYYMNTINKVGICAECGYLGDDNLDFVRDLIINFLNKTKNLETTNYFTYNNKEFFELEETYVCDEECEIYYNFKDFEYIEENMIIGYKLNSKEDIIIDKDSYLLFTNRRVITPGDEVYLKLKKL